MLKVEILILTILFLLPGCNDVKKQKAISRHLIELQFEKIKVTDSLNKKTLNKPTVVAIFATDLDYDKYEKENAKQEYYNLVDFQGYYSSMIIPVLDSMKLENFSLPNKKFELTFNTQTGGVFILDTRKIKQKQGIILFNRRDKPVFWNGNDNEELDFYISEYFK